MDEFQRCGTTFPLNIETRHKRSQFFALMDTGGICSCINFNTFRKLNVRLMQHEVPRVMGADGGDLGSMGTVELTLSIGGNKVSPRIHRMQRTEEKHNLGCGLCKT